MESKEFKEQYERRKNTLLIDKTINPDNRKWFKEILEFYEVKLKRINGFSKLDNGNYKTLFSYIQKCKNVNRWFNNKSHHEIDKKDIERVYNGLEDGKLKPNGDRKSYYQKFFKSKPFEIIGKKDLAKEVIQYSRRDEGVVRFFTEEDFKEIIEHVKDYQMKACLWLGFDIGENMFTLLQLKKKDFERRINDDNKEVEYIIHLDRSVLKRSRTARTELTNYIETVKYLDKVLEDKKDNDLLFDFKHRWVEKCFKMASIKADVKINNGDVPKLKDLRSSMACNLLTKGWDTDNIKARLGHRPSSVILDKYVSYLALKKNKPKKIFLESQYSEMKRELDELIEKNKVKTRDIEEIKGQNQMLIEEIKLIKRLLSLNA